LDDFGLILKSDVVNPRAGDVVSRPAARRVLSCSPSPQIPRLFRPLAHTKCVHPAPGCYASVAHLRYLQVESPGRLDRQRRPVHQWLGRRGLLFR